MTSIYVFTHHIFAIHILIFHVSDLLYSSVAPHRYHPRKHASLCQKNISHKHKKRCCRTGGYHNAAILPEYFFHKSPLNYCGNVRKHTHYSRSQKEHYYAPSELFDYHFHMTCSFCNFLRLLLFAAYIVYIAYSLLLYYFAAYIAYPLSTCSWSMPKNATL